MIQLLRVIPLLFLVAMVQLAGTASAWSQQAAAAVDKTAGGDVQGHLATSVDQLTTKLTAVEKDLDGSHASQAQLGELVSKIPPLQAEVEAVVDRLTPRTAAMKARLDQLGPKPKGAESADISKERATVQKAFDDNDGLLKRAKLLDLKAQQLLNYAAKRQRLLFTSALFARSSSILSPPLWFKIVRETPGNLADVDRAFDDWLEAFNGNLTGGRLLVFWLAIGGVVLLYWPATRLAKRLVARESRADAPSNWQKVLIGCWISLSTAAPMIAVMYGVVFVFSLATSTEHGLAELFSAVQWGVIRVAAAAGLSFGILAPGRSKWRLVNLDDRTSDKLIRIIVGVALIVSLWKIIEALNVVIFAAYQFSVAVRGVGALLVAGALAAALLDLGDDPESDNPDAEAGSPAQRRDWYGLVRVLAWGLILCVTVASLIGYIAFASFLVDQLVLVAGTCAVFFLLVRLIDEACALGFQPSSIMGRNLIYTVGMRRETLGQVSILLSGAARLTLIAVAILVIAAPWGMQSADLPANLHAVFFGFKIGDVTISIASIVVSLITFLLVLAATRAMQNWLEDRYLPLTRLDAGLRNSIKTSLGYCGFLVALALAAANLGVDFQKLAIVAGALSVGIGFGLQSIVNNFVSGLILLWERAVRVGDWIVVGADQGYVRRINVRSTEIETFDRAAVIVPNSNLVSGIVKNLMRVDRVGRLTIEISAHITADPEKIREVLIDIARDNDGILSLPSPQVRFMNLTSSQMTFSLFCFVSDVESMLRTKSDLYFEICKQFRQNGFFDGPPPDPMGVNILGLDRLEDLLKQGRAAADAETVRSLKAS